MSGLVTVEIPDQALERIPLGWAWVKSGNTREDRNRRVQRPKHLQLISEAFYEAAHGVKKRIIIEAPPRHAKSTMVAKGIAWYFDQPEFVDNRVIWTSYGADLARDWGRAVRDDVEEHGRFKLREDVTAANHWNVAGYAGGMTATGYGGTLTGRGANLLIIDDPIKNQEEAMSITTRDATYNWYIATARDRLEPGAAIIIIMQRWHQDDLIGRLLRDAQDKGEQWHVLRFPAIAEDNDPCGRAPGEALWPERYDLEALEALKGTMGWWFDAKYQQNPVPETDKKIDEKNFPIIYELPKNPSDKEPSLLRVYSYYDMAIKKLNTAKKGDFASRCLLALDFRNKYGILNIKRRRKDVGEIESWMMTTMKEDFIKWGCSEMCFESDTGGTGEYAAHTLATALLKFAHDNDMKSMQISYEHPTGPKPVRFDPVASNAKIGNYWIYGHGWDDLPGFLRRLVSLFDGEYDDEFDSISGAHGRLQPSQNQRDEGNTGILI